MELNELRLMNLAALLRVRRGVGVTRFDTQHRVLLFLIILQLFSLIRLGGSLQMLSEPRFHVQNPGETLRLDCSFREDDYNLFDYPIIWRKQQLDEEVQVNVMGSLNEPFVSSSRFSIAFTPTPPTYLFELTIQELKREDNGNYTCDVRGPRSMLLGNVTHQLFIRAPIDQLLLLDGTIHETADLLNVSSPEIIQLVEGRPARLRCVCLGGYPPPSLKIDIGERDVTKQFQFKHELIDRQAIIHHSSGWGMQSESDAPAGTGWGRRAEFGTTYLSNSNYESSHNNDLFKSKHGRDGSNKQGDKAGLRVLIYRAMRWVENYQAIAEDNGLHLKCSAQVPGLGVIMEISQLDVDYTPKINCRTTDCYIGDKDVHIICEVRAKPGTSELYWIIDNNKTRLADGQSVVNYAVHSKDRLQDNNLAVITDTRLVIRQVTAGNFRTYTVVAQNGVGLSVADVQLYHKTTLIPTPTFGGQRRLGADSQVSNRDITRDLREHAYNSGAMVTGFLPISLNTISIYTLIKIVERTRQDRFNAVLTSNR